MGRYAEGTGVPVDRSRAELEALVRKHGATRVASHWDESGYVFAYEIGGRRLRQQVHYPDAATVTQGKRSQPPSVVKNAQEREWRRRWRAQVLIVKAKLELVAGGDSTFEREFMADMLLPNGQTVGEVALPKIAEGYASGKMPRLLLGTGE